MLQNRWPALRHRDFRLLWLGLLISQTGAQMQVAAVNWQVYRLLDQATTEISIFGRSVVLDGDALGLGGIGLARVLPIFVFALIGGALADSGDRRRMMFIGSAVALICALLLTALTGVGAISLGLLYALTLINSGATALATPARQALVPNLVPKHDFTNAVSLNSLIQQLSQIAGPSLAGVMIASAPLEWTYAFNALSFVVVLAALMAMRHRDARAGAAAQVSLGAIIDGFRFVFSTRLLRSTMLLDFWATFFASARTMLPIVAVEMLGVDEVGYGVLSTAQALGGAITGVLLTLRREIRNQGRALLMSVFVFGAATALFGVTTNFALSYLLYALTGAGDTVSAVLRNVIRQTLTPDAMRGRMVGVNQLFFQGGPQLGELEAGVVGEAFGVPFAILSGGVATMLMVLWTAWRYPDLRRYRVAG